jgi:glycosyltransferase involved in cell wall biosynthesis
MKIAIATDAWHPQINGVVRTYENVAENLQRNGHQVSLITPLDFFTVPCPTYPSIHLALFPREGVKNHLESFGPDAIHVATEGPIGHAARAWCLKKGIPFTTSFHTQFPEYIRMRAPVPLNMSYAYFRKFHGAARKTLVPTASQQKRLQARGFENTVVWTRGVNTGMFYPRPGKTQEYKRPLFVYAGRVAVEKNIEAFLDLDLPGGKLVIGDGPDLNKLVRKYPAVKFAGFKTGIDLAEHIASGDVFVFPSLTDTFGIVMLEAMACGLPVAAFPVTGPIDVIENGINGVVDQDLQKAALSALQLDSEDCVRMARQYSWQRCADVFVSYLEPVHGHSARLPDREMYAENC